MAQAQVTRSPCALTSFNLLNPAMNNGIARVAVLLATVGWSLIAPQPAQAQLGVGDDGDGYMNPQIQRITANLLKRFGAFPSP